MSTPPQGSDRDDQNGPSPAGPGQFPEIAPGVPRYGQYAPEGYVPPNLQGSAGQSTPGPVAPNTAQPWPATSPNTKTIPPLVQRGFILILVAAAVHLVTSLLGLFQIPQMRELLLRDFASLPQVNDSMIDMAITLAFILNAIGFVLYLVVAFNIRAGKNWARILGTVLAASSLIILFGSPFAIVQVALGGIGIGYCWLAASRDYFKR